MSLAELAKQVRSCTRCELRANSTQPVMGTGIAGAKYLLLGEAPGANEDREGIPFIGLAGKRLNTLIALAGIDINECYLTNVCKCRLPKNRNPRKTEIRACSMWLDEEIRLVCPEYIITLGAVPLAVFSDYGVGQLHGTMFDVEIEDGN